MKLKYNNEENIIHHKLHVFTSFNISQNISHFTVSLLFLNILAAWYSRAKDKLMQWEHKPKVFLHLYQDTPEPYSYLNNLFCSHIHPILP